MNDAQEKDVASADFNNHRMREVGQRYLSTFYEMSMLSIVQLRSFHKCRDVSTGATGATEVAPKFSDTLTLSPPGGGANSAHQGGGADSAHHCRGRI